jgi:hypothetical protein
LKKNASLCEWATGQREEKSMVKLMANKINKQTGMYKAKYSEKITDT